MGVHDGQWSMVKEVVVRGAVAKAVRISQRWRFLTTVRAACIFLQSRYTK